MNISQLTPDAKFELAKKLPTHDLLALCSTDTGMRQICISNRFSPIWSQRLKENYNIDYRGPNGYIEYLLMTYTMKNKYYAATIHNMYDSSDHTVILCRSREEGYAKLTQKLNSKEMLTNITHPDYSWDRQNVPYIYIRETLNETNSFQIGPYEVSLYESSFDLTPTKNYEELYRQKLNTIIETLRRDFGIDTKNLDTYLLENLDGTGSSILQNLIDYHIIPEPTDEQNYDVLELMLDDLISFN